jgi:hypothetical protein
MWGEESQIFVSISSMFSMRIKAAKLRLNCQSSPIENYPVSSFVLIRVNSSSFGLQFSFYVTNNNKFQITNNKSQATKPTPQQSQQRQPDNNHNPTTRQQSQPDNNRNNPNKRNCNIHQEVINFAKAWQDGFYLLQVCKLKINLKDAG